MDTKRRPQFYRRLTLICLICISSVASTALGAKLRRQAPTDRGVDVREEWRGFHGKLSELVPRVAELYGLPMLIAVAQSTDTDIDIPAGTISAREILDTVVRMNPEYVWKPEDTAIYFYNRSLKESPNCFLNWKIKSFTIEKSVADVDLILRAELAKVRYGVQGEGGTVIGLRSTELAAHSLPRIVLHNVTAAEILLRVLSIDHGFYSMVTFPAIRPNRERDLNAAFASWQWIPLPERNSNEARRRSAACQAKHIVCRQNRRLAPFAVRAACPTALGAQPRRTPYRQSMLMVSRCAQRLSTGPARA